MSRVRFARVLLGLIVACGGRVAPIGEDLPSDDGTTTVVGDGSQPPPEPPTPPPATDFPTDIPTQRQPPQALVCKFLRGGRLDSVYFPGAVLTPGPAVQLDTFDVHSMGRDDDSLFVCTSSGGDGVVARIDANDGAVERSDARCIATTGDADGIDVLRWNTTGNTLDHFANWGQVLTDTPERSLEYSAQVSRISLFFDQIVGTWNATDLVDVSRRDDGKGLASRTLDRDGDPIHGLATAPDGRLLVTTRNQGIQVYDLFEGTWLEQHESDSAFNGISAIHCTQTKQPGFDTCAGKETGAYCSSVEYAQSYRCKSGSFDGSVGCLGKTGFCQSDANGQAVLDDDGELVCTPTRHESSQ